MSEPIYHSPDEPSPQDLAVDASATGSRVRASYRRKRAVQACLTCRARKSRCDGRRPQCGFCAGINSDCHYPDIEATTLDKGSVMILERMKAMEDSILRRLDLIPTTADPSHGVGYTALRTTTSTFLPPGAFWPNGDVILMWKSIELLILQLPDSQALRSFWEEFKYSQSSSKSSPIPISPTVYQSGQETEGRLRRSCASDEKDRLMHPEMIHSLVCSYVTHIHSKSPILDLPALSNTAVLVATRRIDPSMLSVAELPSGVEAADMAIVFFALALAQVASSRYSQNERIEPNYYVQLALPWLGLSQFGDITKNLQANLLLSSYYMWTLNHWDAWCIIDATASRAEKLLLGNQSVINDPLNHRVMWAVAKMHFELVEECQMYRPVGRVGKLMKLVSTTSLPQPPDEPFDWPGVPPECESDTWYYYLAETSSRRLIERIKVELYSGQCKNR
ncbi:hypothetical protein DM02DRAFT_682156 [Periconia macrospinosa]|uniref:Zn(2)-C6 fungal-type domain-containing protein n=1 Tax=Periconia macrospinosa TaxID=97972 RepID=A0A2V1DJY8_9PLEO|nr:hypothetical protein DM02DRAFT_682156 [Periconia macrospinosa]